MEVIQLVIPLDSGDITSNYKINAQGNKFLPKKPKTTGF